MDTPEQNRAEQRRRRTTIIASHCTIQHIALSWWKGTIGIVTNIVPNTNGEENKYKDRRYGGIQEDRKAWIRYAMRFSSLITSRRTSSSCWLAYIYCITTLMLKYEFPSFKFSVISFSLNIYWNACVLLLHRFPNDAIIWINWSNMRNRERL